MVSDDISLAQSVIREFGYDVQEHCHKAANTLIGLGMLEEAEVDAAAGGKA